MYGLDWSNPETFWLNFTNVVLGVVTLACFAIFAYAVGREVFARVRARYLVFENEPHMAHVPELGFTMADGGEPLPKDGPKK